MGHSAGAYIAAMLSFDPQWLRRVGLNSQTDLAGFIGLAGPYDFLPIESRTLRTIFGGANRAETQPIFFITGKEAPSLLITAWRDRLVSPENSRRMAEKIHAHCGVAEERTYRGVGHLTLIGAFYCARSLNSSGASHGRPICQHLSGADTEQDTRRARLR
jgi:acetyl esterase/lipase